MANNNSVCKSFAVVYKCVCDLMKTSCHEVHGTIKLIKNY